MNSVFVAGTVDNCYPCPVKSDTLDQVCDYLNKLDLSVVNIIDFDFTNAYTLDKEYVKPSVNGYDLDRDYKCDGSVYSGYADSKDKNKGLFYQAEINIRPRYLYNVEYWIMTDRANSSYSEALIKLVDLLKVNSKGTLLIKHENNTFKIAI